MKIEKQPNEDLKWLTAEEAMKIPEGSNVLIRRLDRSPIIYEACNYFRPDWLADKIYGHRSSFLVLEKRIK